MIGNTRLYEAMLALATQKGDVRHRVAIAMNIIAAMHPDELKEFDGLSLRLEKLKKVTSRRGFLENGRCSTDAFTHTALASQNKTYVKHAEEIFSIWVNTLNKVK